jgi:hypothetical protein
VALYRSCPWISGGQDDNEVGVQDDGHLKTQPSVALFAAFGDDLDRVYRGSIIGQALA